MGQPHHILLVHMINGTISLSDSTYSTYNTGVHFIPKCLPVGINDASLRMKIDIADHETWCIKIPRD